MILRGRGTQSAGDIADGSFLEYGFELYLDTQALRYPAHQPDHEQGVSAEVEERIVETHLIDREDLGSRPTY